MFIERSACLVIATLAAAVLLLAFGSGVAGDETDALFATVPLAPGGIAYVDLIVTA